MFLLVAGFAAAAAPTAADAGLQTVCTTVIRLTIPPGSKGQKQIRDEAARYAAALDSNGAWKALDYASQARHEWPPREHLQRVLVMSKAIQLSRDAGAADKP